MSPARAPSPLNDLPFFAGLTDTLLWHLGKAAERRELAKDETLFKPGDERQLLAVIVSGAIVIVQGSGKSAIDLATFGTGEVIGEGVLLDEGGTHATSARAVKPTEIVCFQREPLLKLLKEQPALYAALVGRAARITSDRIKRANAALAGATADAARIREQVDQWIGSVTVLVPAIGCDTAIKVAREALDSGRNVNDLVLEKKLLTREKLDALLGKG